MSTDTPTEDVAEAGAEKTKLALEVKVDKKGACERHVTVTVPREDIDRYFGRAFDELCPKAEVPGFRAGRAPRKLVEARFKEQISDQVKGSLLMDSMTQVNEEHQFSAISEPDFDFDAIEIPPQGAMTFEFDLEVRPEFALPVWKGLSIEKPVRDYSADDVTHHLKDVLARFSHMAPYEGAAETGDYVVVDLVFKHNGEVVSTASEQTIRIKPTLSFEDANLAGFDKLMIGAKADETRSGKVKVSDSSENEALRGQEVDVDFKVLEVKRLELPELNPAFLERIGGFKDEAELREFVLGELQRQLKYHQQKQVRSQITALLTESATWELPPDLVRRQFRRELDRAVMELRASGFGDDVIRAHSNELQQNSRRSTERALKEHFILERIAEEEKLDALPEDYDTEVELIAQQSDESPRRVRARLEKRGQMDSLRNQIIERKVIEMIAAAAVINEKPFVPPATQTEAVALSVAAGEKNESEIPEAKFAFGGEEEKKS
ncbi:MAG TPA: trigger factor [Pirellulaceae bacterium]|nr:trigger factor [Pirellulaceae bacterium]